MFLISNYEIIKNATVNNNKLILEECLGFQFHIFSTLCLVRPEAV